jgi:peptide-methionine (R)-S-oxide reductase
MISRTLPVLGFVSFLLVACHQTTTITVPVAGSQSSSASQEESSSVMMHTSSSKSATPVAMMHIQTSSVSSSIVTSSVSTKPVQTSSVSSIWNLQIALAAMPTTKDAWLKIITADQYAVLWDAGTETPFTSPLLNEHRKGTFVSADCGEPVFRSEQKFDSGTGWPSFWAPISKDAVIEKTDTSLGYTRTEIQSKCGGHLGHVFTDGPQPTGLRYCMNGLALRFIPDAVQ